MKTSYIIIDKKDGPVVEFANEYKCWHLNNKLYREDDLVIKGANGSK